MRIKVPVSFKGMHMFLLKSKNAARSTALSRVSVLTFLAVVFLSNLANEAWGVESYGRFLGVTKWKGSWTIDFGGGGTISDGVGGTYTYKITGSSRGNFTLDFKDSDPKSYISWGSAPNEGTGGFDLNATWVRGENDISTYKITTLGNGTERDLSGCGLCIYIKNGNYFFQAPSLLFDGTYTESGDSPLTIPFTEWIPPTPVPPTLDYILQRWSLPEAGFKISDSADYIYTYQLPGVVIDVALPLHVTWTLIPADEPTIEITKLEQKPKSKIASATDMVYKNGRLTLYAEATVKPEKYAKYVEWEVPSFGDVAPARIQKKFKKGIASVRVSYNEMPADNGGFGEKTLKATMKDFGLEASKTFRIFFKRDTKDNPEGEIPNWYYYWKQGAVPNLEKFTYDKNMNGGNYNWETGDLKIGKDAPIRSFGGMVLNLTSKDENHKCTLDRDSVKSINGVAAIVIHELTHKTLVENAKLNGDSDGDMIADFDEPGNPWTYWNDPNTYGLSVDLFYGGNPGDAEAWADAGKTNKEREERHDEIAKAKAQLGWCADNELKAQMSEKARVLRTSIDWAYPGSQSGGE